MMERIDTSPRFRARLAGVFYLLTFVTGGLAIFARHGLVVDENAPATATNILAHEFLFRLGTAGDILVVAWYVAVTALFYGLFKPVSKSGSLVAACFGLMGCAVLGFTCLFQLAPFVVLQGAQYSSVFRVEQLQALAYMSLELYGQTYSIAVVFFGFYCLLIGGLILKSTFLPRILGALMVLAGLGWLTFLSTPLAKSLSPYILAPGIVGEGSLTVWLLIKGVDDSKWKEEAKSCEVVGG
ncbi:MAG: DUF4386 domain-containing protein [Acidobacteriia bacterium]|nr:DUF4386 domain-containing protein [Terriglobia bacterium]